MHTEQKLGPAALWFLMIQNLLLGVFLLVVAIVIALFGHSVVGTIPNGTGPTSLNFLLALGYVEKAAYAAALIALLVGAVSTLITYNYTTFHLDDFALKIRRGFIDKKEMLIPYRQIQDVDINRPLLYRILGVSSLIILTAGHEDPGQKEGEAEGVFNVVDAAVAEELQKELVEMASVQMVDEVGPSAMQPVLGDSGSGHGSPPVGPLPTK
jgi:uncharacterized membrane protein YdbT with pleckstrin-like domain